MKILVFSLLITLPNVAFNQITKTDSLELMSDSTLLELNDFLSEYAKIMSNWSPEKKKRFNEIFVLKRGHITIPKEPINWEE